MEKENFEIGILLIIISFIFNFGYLTTTKGFVLSFFSVIFGIIGIILLYLSGKIDHTKTILSTIVIIMGGIIVPIIPQIEKLSGPLTVLLYSSIIILLILKPPEKYGAKATVQQ
ncbi:MAG: hypothetical protein WA091_03835 [Minisyncoccales bacterium]